MDKSLIPAIVLIEPKLAENMGTAARAMMNCGLTDLRLVRPHEEPLAPRAIAAASGADAILHQARVFATTGEAIADLQRVYATTGRNRY
ncbi:MAG: RNA methyltransferase, partial [Rhodospirillales bacterium]|nr:RNA methyltransferase [Rhodospirillales bacterium]